MPRMLTRLTKRTYVLALLATMLAVLSGCEGEGPVRGGATDKGAHSRVKKGRPVLVVERTALNGRTVYRNPSRFPHEGTADFCAREAPIFVHLNHLFSAHTRTWH